MCSLDRETLRQPPSSHHSETNTKEVRINSSTERGKRRLLCASAATNNSKFVAEREDWKQRGEKREGVINEGDMNCDLNEDGERNGL